MIFTFSLNGFGSSTPSARSLLWSITATLSANPWWPASTSWMSSQESSFTLRTRCREQRTGCWWRCSTRWSCRLWGSGAKRGFTAEDRARQWTVSMENLKLFERKLETRGAGGFFSPARNARAGSTTWYGRGLRELTPSSRHIYFDHDAWIILNYSSIISSRNLGSSFRERNSLSCRAGWRECWLTSRWGNTSWTRRLTPGSWPRCLQEAPTTTCCHSPEHCSMFVAMSEDYMGA